MEKLKRHIRQWIVFFMIVLFFSGLTAIPAEQGLSLVLKYFPGDGTIKAWLEKVLFAIQQTSKNYPFLFYGYDWLAFAHFVIAILFIGPWRDPVKNKWVIEFGMIACMLIVPFALIAGHFRDIPFWWRAIDCSFGIIGLIPLNICYQKIKRLEKMMNEETSCEKLIE